MYYWWEKKTVLHHINVSGEIFRSHASKCACTSLTPMHMCNLGEICIHFAPCPQDVWQRTSLWNELVQKLERRSNERPVVHGENGTIM